MGFIFHVLPGRIERLAVVDLAERASEGLRHYLAGVPIEALVHLTPELARRGRAALSARAAEARVALGGADGPGESFGPEGEPAALIFCVEPGGGGGFVRRFPLEDPDAAEAARAARGAAGERGEVERVEARLVHGFVYTVERILGQPPLATLAHGFLAAALAEATDGLVVSVDEAWDSALWPCTGARLDEAFMRPAHATSETHRRRAEGMLREVAPALAAFDEEFVAAVVDEIVAALVADVNDVRGDEAGEKAAFDRALVRLDTVRLLSATLPLREHEALIGSASLGEPGRPPRSAFARLRPSAAEYGRWVAHLGEHLA